MDYLLRRTSIKHVDHIIPIAKGGETKLYNLQIEVGKEFHIYMEAKDQSFGFDFFGTYQVIQPYKYILSLLGDGRTLEVSFKG